MGVFTYSPNTDEASQAPSIQQLNMSWMNTFTTMTCEGFLPSAEGLLLPLYIEDLSALQWSTFIAS